jgi:asparagine synthase (glutamine-hydrolysing)
MCGINGFSFLDKGLISKMMIHTKNRGPDAEGLFLDDNISLSHNRLSIIDLNSRANQPMRFKNFIISFNGEIYNYKELQKDLEISGHKFTTNSDTEVILQLFEKYNIEAFNKLSGIFSISIWDIKRKTLYLVRDTVGVKPLYYLHKKNEKKLFFSSSIKSLLLSSDKREINKNAFIFYTNFGRNDDVETIFKGIFKLLPGEILIWKNKKIIKNKILDIKPSNKKIKDGEIKSIIEKSIDSQLISDVPIALSLSGGVDSNIVYSVMRKKIKNFNIYSFYFKDYEKFNEDFNVAKNNANFYKNNFVPIEIGFNEFADNCEKVVDIVEEPTGNQCSILNYAMSKKISEKILMTGDGGDESFTGYDRYRSIHILNFLRKFNILNINLDNLNSKYKNLNRFFYNNPKDVYLSFSEQNIYKNPHKYYRNFKLLKKDELFLNHAKNLRLKNNLNNISLMDLDTIVPNEYLLRNDKIFMNEGIEVRVPLLDLKIVENFLNQSEFKKFQYKFESKSLVKNLFKNDIHQLVGRKWGLQSPYAKWMKGPLQKFLKEVLSKDYYSNSRDYFNFDKINELISIHKEKYYNPDLLWSLAMMQVFLRNFKL